MPQELEEQTAQSQQRGGFFSSMFGSNATPHCQVPKSALSFHFAVCTSPKGNIGSTIS